jgi:integrase
MATGGGGPTGGRPRRARGEGSILPYRGVWRVRIRWRGQEGTWFAPSHAQAVVLLRAKLRERDDPSQPKPGKGTVDQWVDEWLAQRALSRPRTYPFYRQKLAHIQRDLGNLRLSDLTAHDIRVALLHLSAEGMSPTMLQHVFKSLSTALTTAAKEGRIAKNPCLDVDAPHRSEFEAPTLTVEQSRRLIYVAWDTRLGPLIVLALSTGMRAGELLALTWDDVDLERGLITVNKSVQWKPGGKHVAGQTKTRAARRTIRVERLALDALELQRQRVLRMRLQAKDWADRNLVFPTPRGTYMIPSGGFVREFRALLNRAECPRIRFHDLRHTAGLFLTRSVGLVVASRILGHADPGITARYYGHAAQEDFTAAARAMGELLQPRAFEALP